MNNPFIEIQEQIASMQQTIDKLPETIKEIFTTHQSPNNQLPDIGDIELAVSITGYSKSAIYSMTSSKEKSIPHWKKGKKLFFSASELKQWITEGNHSNK